MSVLDTLRFRAKKIKLEEASHKYTLDTHPHIDFLSITTFLGKFERKFDPIKMSELTARKANAPGYDGKPEYVGKNAAEIRALWQSKNSDITTSGTRTHSFAERTILGKEQKPPQTERERKCRESWHKWWTALDKSHIVDMAPELTMYDVDLELSGTADLICLTRDDTLMLWDWKTNSEIKTKSWDGKECYYRPINHIPVCEFNKYSLQLNLYNYLIYQTTQRYVSHMEIVHLKEDGVDTYKVPDLDQDILLLIDYRRKQLGKKEEKEEVPPPVGGS